MDREAGGAALEAWDAARAGLAALPLDALTGAELVAVYERRQLGLRQEAALDHSVLATLAERFTAADFGGTGLKDVLAQRLHLDTADAKRRLDAAGMLGPRWTFTGEELPAQWDNTSAALRRGLIDPAHVEVIRKFFTKLAPWVDQAARADAERDLARWAQGMCPQDLQQLADHLVEVIDPDGAEPDHDTQQAKRSLKMGRQRSDGMTPVRGHLDPETAALLDVVLARDGAPGHNLPEDPGAGEVAERDITGNCRSAHPRTTPPRRAEDRAAARRGRRRSDQRATGHHRGHHHRRGPRIRYRVCPHRRRHPAADTRPDPAGRPVPALPGGVRRPHRRNPATSAAPGAAPPPPNGWRCSPATGAAPAPAAPATPSTARSTTPSATGPTADEPTSTNSLWPAHPTTTSSNKPNGPPADATAAPNGSHHPPSTPANTAPTTTTTHGATSPNETTTQNRHSRRPIRSARAGVRMQARAERPCRAPPRPWPWRQRVLLWVRVSGSRRCSR